MRTRWTLWVLLGINSVIKNYLPRARWLILRFIVIAFSLKFTVSAQYSQFDEPRWNPTRNIVAVSNATTIRLYTSDFSQLLNEFELTTVRNTTISNTALIWSPNGTTLAVTIQGGDVTPALQIWNIELGQMIAQIIDIDPDATFAWNPQSTHIAVSHERGLADTNLRIYDVSDTTIFNDYSIRTQRMQIENIRWSPNGQKIAIHSSGTLYLLNLQNEQVYTSNVPMYGSFETPRFAFSQDSRYLIGVTNPSAVDATILDTETDQIVGVLKGHTDRIFGINWGNQYIVTIGMDGLTKFWSPTTFEEIASFQTGLTSIPSFSPDSSRFVASYYDLETIVVRDSITGEIVASLDPVMSPSKTPFPTHSLEFITTPTFTPTRTPTHGS